LTKNFAGLSALDQVSFDVDDGSITGIIGPNGAGKTTAFNLITGVLKPSSGRILFAGADITAVSLERRVGLGLARTYQHPRVFSSLTIIENVMLGYHHRSRFGLLSCGFRLPAAGKEEQRIRAEAEEHLELVGLIDRRDQVARDLPLGQQRHVELARALAAKPKLLLLDEPAAGLNEHETDELRVLVERLRGMGLAVLLVEHHMRFVMAVCDKVVVLNFGRVIDSGPPAHVKASAAVVEAYLGSDDDA